MTEIGIVKQTDACFLGVTTLPISKGRGHNVPKILGPSTYVKTVWPKSGQIWYDNTWGRSEFLGVNHASVPRGQVPASKSPQYCPYSFT